ncbi:hypothetical protein BKA93DRAFT_821477 [Sparassis latifolia]
MPSSSTVNTPVPAMRHSPMDDIAAAMAASSSPPSSPMKSSLGKRRHSDDQSGEEALEPDDLPIASDTEFTVATTATSAAMTLSVPQRSTPSAQGSNMTIAELGVALLKQLGKKLTKKTKLGKDQAAEVEAFASSALNAEQNLRLFIKLQEVQNMLTEIRRAQAEYHVSEYLGKNIHKIAYAVLLSVNLPSYVGATAVRPVQEQLKRERFDMPDNIEHNPADWGKVKTVIQYHQTQTCAAWKKAIHDSIALEDPTEHMDIFSLTRKVTSGNCTVTIGLCARVALMREIFCEDTAHSDSTFWRKVNERLAFIHNTAKGDQKAINKAMRHILKSDHSKHRQSKEKVKDVEQTDEFQVGIDSIMATGSE